MKTSKQMVTGTLIALSWQSVAYGLGIFGRQIAMYLALPLFTNHMPQTEFGAVAVTTAFLSFINTLSNAGLPASTFRLYNDSEEPEHQRQTLGSAQVLIAGYALLAGLLMSVAATPLAQWLLDDSNYAPVIHMVAVVLFIESLINYGQIVLRLQVRPFASSMQSLFQIMLQLSVAVVLVRNYNLGIYGYWLGFLAGGLVALLVMLWLVRGALEWHISTRYLQDMLVYGLPLIPATISMWALRLVDRALISSIAGLNEVAVYEIGYKIGAIVLLVLGPFNRAWPPFAFSSMKKQNARQIYQNSLTYVTAGCTFVALGVIAFRTDMVQFMAPPSYAHAVSVVPWVAIAIIAWGMYPILSIGLKIAKRTTYIAAVAISAASVNIIFNLLLIPHIGIRGAAIATLVGYVTLAGGAYAAGQHFYSFPIDWPRLGKLVLAGGLTILAIIQLERFDVTVWDGRILRATVLLIFPLLLMVTNFFTLSQCREAIQYGKYLLNRKKKRI